MKQKKAAAAGPEWEETGVRDFPGSAPARIADEWMLISAGEGASGAWNTMTASWGGMGVLWGRETAFVFVRPTRYSFAFFNESALFSLSFFDPSRHDALEFCGAHSGRDYDKAEAAGLTPIVFTGGRSAGGIGFQEASETIVCRTLYTHDFDPARFLDPAISGNYPDKDYHRMFIGEILGLRVRRGG